MTDSPPPDREDADELWRRMVEQKRALTQTQARFWRAPGANERLVSALSSGNVERSVALDLLRELSMDDPQIMEKLLDSSTSPGSALRARQALANSPSAVRRMIPPAILDRLAASDAHDWWRYAELLLHLYEFGTLAEMARRSRAREDPDLVELAEDIADWMKPFQQAPTSHQPS